MATEYIKVNPQGPEKEKINRAAEILKKGGTVAFPTETVYGLGADALNPLAVKKIFEAKGRPMDNPLIVHVDGPDMAKNLAVDIPLNAVLAMEHFWPGPLTVVLKASGKVPREVTAGLDTVGLRMPDSTVAIELIKTAGIPVAAPSANISGRPSPTSALHVAEDLDGKIDAILDGGPARLGVESTVVDFTGVKPVILRPGGITREQLAYLLGEVDMDPSLIEDCSETRPRSPGMKYTHYSPEADMYLVEGSLDFIVKTINQYTSQKNSKRTGILATEETKKFYSSENVISLGSRANLEEIANKIYGSLRAMDRRGVEVIYAEGFPSEGLGLAIMNRLRKAAGGNIIREK